MKRSKSWSVATPTSVSDCFETEKVYVENLQSRAEDLTGLTLLNMEDKSDTVSTFDSETSRTPDSPRVHDLLETEKMMELQQEGGSLANCRLNPASPASTPSTQSRASSEYTEPELEFQLSAVACNKGNRGHPELCGRPCVLFATGRCSGNCGFCHYTHHKRRGHLDRRNRTLLQAMSFHDRLTLFRPMIESRLEEMAQKFPEAGLQRQRSRGSMASGAF